MVWTRGRSVPSEIAIAARDADVDDKDNDFVLPSSIDDGIEDIDEYLSDHERTSHSDSNSLSFSSVDDESIASIASSNTVAELVSYIKHNVAGGDDDKSTASSTLLSLPSALLSLRRVVGTVLNPVSALHRGTKSLAKQILKSFNNDDDKSHSSVDSMNLYYRDAVGVEHLKGHSVSSMRDLIPPWVSPDEQRGIDMGLQGIEKQKQQSSDIAKVLDYEYFVEDAYPVGTTEEQCKQVLSQAHDMDNEEYWRKYDREILDNFQELLQN